MPEAALELLAVLARFITEEPQMTRPNRGDFDWKWQRRPQPLRELYLDAFFEKCFGSYAAVKRQGLDRASKKDLAYCTTWLRERGWQRVSKQLSDGQRVRVWRAPDTPSSGADATGQRTPNENTSAEKASQDCGVAGVAGVAGSVAGVAGSVAGVAGSVTGQRTPKENLSTTAISSKTIPNQQLASLVTTYTQHDSINDAQSEILTGGEEEKFLLGKVRGKNQLGVRTLDGFSPATPDDLEEAFPRDRFLALDVETIGLSATSDSVRIVQFSDGESAAMDQATRSIVHSM